MTLEWKHFDKCCRSNTQFQDSKIEQEHTGFMELTCLLCRLQAAQAQSHLYWHKLWHSLLGRASPPSLRSMFRALKRPISAALSDYWMQK